MLIEFIHIESDKKLSQVEMSMPPLKHWEIEIFTNNKLENFIVREHPRLNHLASRATCFVIEKFKYLQEFK